MLSLQALLTSLIVHTFAEYILNVGCQGAQLTRRYRYKGAGTGEGDRVPSLDIWVSWGALGIEIHLASTGVYGESQPTVTQRLSLNPCLTL